MWRMIRRGVLMTASSRKSRNASWLEEDDGEESGADGENETRRKASNEEWRDIEREVREEKRRIFADKEFKSGRRGAVVDYDDVAAEEEADEQPPSGGLADASGAEDSEPEAAPRGREATEEASASPRASPEGGGEAAPLPPDAAVTAGQVQRERKRGGQRKTGAQRRREANDRAEGDEDGPRKKKRKQDDKEEDPDRWIKCRLAGEAKPKRIDTTRMVYYHDWDRPAASSHQEVPGAPRQDADEAPSVTKPEPPPGNFRAQVRRDLWDDDSDDE